ncbi:MAG: hypothetical protein P9L95_00845 [Candidatus Tenebribacter mawsonii]|nr:hypothetical protein [Candidatus Tenebribacter mawsonii]
MKRSAEQISSMNRFVEQQEEVEIVSSRTQKPILSNPIRNREEKWKVVEMCQEYKKENTHPPKIFQNS